MSRRSLFGLPALFSVPLTHDCEWAQGPFYIRVAASYEEPQYYPPSALIQVEHCTVCGLLRLPADLRKKTGKNLAATP